MNNSWARTNKTICRRAEMRINLRKVFKGSGLWESGLKHALFHELRERAKCRATYKYDVNMALIMTSSRAPLLECDDVYEDEAMDAFYTRAPAPDQEREMIAADMGYTSSSSDPCGPQLGHYLEERHDQTTAGHHLNPI